jgi:protease-4
MGDVAASGATGLPWSADEVIADAATITGSIGVFALIPNFTGTVEKIGVNTAGVGTTWIAEATDLTRPLDKRLAQIVEAGIGHTYREFLTIVAANRKSTPDQINEVAQGRVWTGAQAKERGLVDVVGGLDLAVKTAARRAGLGDVYRVEYIEHEPRGLGRYLALLFGQLGAVLRDGFGWESLAGTLTETVVPRAPRELRLLLDAKADPTRAVSYCFCDLR